MKLTVFKAVPTRFDETYNEQVTLLMFDENLQQTLGVSFE